MHSIKTNKLISAVQNLSLVEVRLIQLAIIDARETGLGLSAEKPLTIGAERYARAFNVNKKMPTKCLKKPRIRYLTVVLVSLIAMVKW
nr:replication initiation protein [Moraxella catarrhalis]